MNPAPLRSPVATSAPFPPLQPQMVKRPYQPLPSGMQVHRPAQYSVPNYLDSITGLPLNPCHQQLMADRISPRRGYPASIDIPSPPALSYGQHLDWMRRYSASQQVHASRSIRTSINHTSTSADLQSSPRYYPQGPPQSHPKMFRSTNPRQFQRSNQILSHNPDGMGSPPSHSPYTSDHQISDTGFIRLPTRPRPSNLPLLNHNYQNYGHGPSPPLKQLPYPQSPSLLDPQNKTPSLHRPQYAGNATSSKSPSTLPASSSPQNLGVPEVTLWKPSIDGEDKIIRIPDNIFQEQLCLDGWSISWFRKGSLPPPGSFVVELYQPKLLWSHPSGSPYRGIAVNTDEVLAENYGLAASPSPQDVDLLLSFESPR